MLLKKRYISHWVLPGFENCISTRDNCIWLNPLRQKGIILTLSETKNFCPSIVSSILSGLRAQVVAGAHHQLGMRLSLDLCNCGDSCDSTNWSPSSLAPGALSRFKVTSESVSGLALVCGCPVALPAQRDRERADIWRSNTDTRYTDTNCPQRSLSILWRGY